MSVEEGVGSEGLGGHGSAVTPDDGLVSIACGASSVYSRGRNDVRRRRLDSGSLCRAVAGPFSSLVSKAALASSSLGSGITQYLGIGFMAGGSMSGMADTWPNAQAFCHVSAGF